MEPLSDLREIQNRIKRIMEDPLAKILIKNSHLTETQLETLLIDILADDMIDMKWGYEQKSKTRLSKAGVSRGAFNQTLRQARKNITQAIYTVLLLGYLGILDTPKLSPFLEASNRLEEYMEAYKEAWNESKSKTADETKLKIVSSMRKELESSLFDLSASKIIRK